MHVEVKAYFNPEPAYTKKSRLRIVGKAVYDEDGAYDLSEWQEEHLCELVRQLLSPNRPDGELARALDGVANRYRAEGLRPMRPGDVVYVFWDAEEVWSERGYVCTADGFRSVELEPVEV